MYKLELCGEGFNKLTFMFDNFFQMTDFISVAIARCKGTIEVNIKKKEDE